MNLSAFRFTISVKKQVMENFRKYGNPPFNIAVIHGGPGAPGEMAPVARELSKEFGVLEPLQAATSLKGQVEELKDALKDHANHPVILIGHSWGALLSFIFTAHYPSLVKKLILVSSGPYEQKYAESIMGIRLGRLSEKEKEEAKQISNGLKNKEIKNKNELFKRFGKLLSKADTYDPLPVADETIECDAQIFQNVWNEAEKLRQSGQLLKLGGKIQCPVVAIHGNYDPHPAEGVQKPLSSVLKNFKFILLENCGHDPWKEKQAKEKFYESLKNEL